MTPITRYAPKDEQHPPSRTPTAVARPAYGAPPGSSSIVDSLARRHRPSSGRVCSPPPGTGRLGSPGPPPYARLGATTCSTLAAPGPGARRSHLTTTRPAADLRKRHPFTLLATRRRAEGGTAARGTGPPHRDRGRRQVGERGVAPRSQALTPVSARPPPSRPRPRGPVRTDLADSAEPQQIAKKLKMADTSQRSPRAVVGAPESTAVAAERNRSADRGCRPIARVAAGDQDRSRTPAVKRRDNRAAASPTTSARNCLRPRLAASHPGTTQCGQRDHPADGEAPTRSYDPRLGSR